MVKEYYIKKGKRYVPVGIYDLPNNLPEGIWYVRRYDGSTSYTKLSIWETGEILDIKKVCAQLDFVERLVEALNKLDQNIFSLHNISMYDFAKKLSLELINGKDNKEKKG